MYKSKYIPRYSPVLESLPGESSCSEISRMVQTYLDGDIDMYVRHLVEYTYD